MSKSIQGGSPRVLSFRARPPHGAACASGIRAVLLSFLACVAVAAAGQAFARQASESGDASAHEAAGQRTAQEHFKEVSGKIEVDGRTIDYTARAGTLLLRDASGQPTAEVFYMAYVRNGDKAGSRPLTFLWGGGPGGASEAANIAGFGPMRLPPGNATLARPDALYRLTPNSATLLGETDLVFLDPVGTGFSRPLGEKKASDFWGLHQDAQAMAAAITRYVEMNQRWPSPKFLWGVSYGTARASMLANLLQGQGMGLNGVMLVAPVLNFGVYSFGLDHAFSASLPTMAAIAWHHGKAGRDGYADMAAFLEAAREFAQGDYARALSQGNRLPESERARIATRLSGFTGLSERYLADVNLRVSPARFRRELLRDQGLVIGRLDGRVTMRDHDNAGEYAEADASLQAGQMFPLVAAFKDHLSRDFGYRSDRPYLLFNPEAIAAWDWTHHLPDMAGIPAADIEDHNIFPMTAWPAADLAAAMRTNRGLKVFVANAYFDLATPFGWAEYDIAHATFDKELAGNVSFGYYDAGHAIYMDDEAVQALKRDLAAFIHSTLSPAGPALSQE